jgi:hypothetical protein
MDLSRHARARMQQRGIPAAALELLLDHGRVRPAGGGRDIVFLDNKYAIVESDGTVITVGHRYRRIPRRR